MKEISRDKKITVMPAPAVVNIPLSQHIGCEGKPVVEAGEKVKKGQLLAKFDGGLSAYVLSSVSGTVKGFTDIVGVAGLKQKHIIIENDFEESEELLPLLSDPSACEIIDRVKAAGIVGMGGAGFPLHVKLCPPKEKPIDTLIINGAECEPYITCDFRLMIDYPEQVVKGAKLLQKALGAKNLIIGLEQNKIEAFVALSNLDVSLSLLKTKYPQGAEKQLIYAVTSRKVPRGGLPMDVGVTVDNVHTAYSLYQAVYEGKKSYERVLTVSGQAVKEAKNLLVRTGTSYEEVLNFCGGLKEPAKKVLSGGPMMGFSQHTLSTAVTKGTSAILFLTETEINNEKASVCINCGKCAKSCPMYLMPMYIDSSTIAGNLPLAKTYNALDCIECGCCSFVCPAKRPLVQSIRLAKKLIKERKI